MDVFRFALCVLENLLSDIGYDQSRITPNNLSFMLLIAFNLGKVLFHYINDKVCIFIGQFTDRVKEHTSQRIQGVIYFQNLRIYSSQKLLIYSIESFNLRHCNFKIRDCSFNLKPIKFHFRSRLNQDFRNRDCLARIFLYLLNKLIFGKRFLALSTSSLCRCRIDILLFRIARIHVKELIQGDLLCSRRLCFLFL